MKRRAVVHDVGDPKNLGRIKARVVGFESGKDITPWAWPNSPFGGPEYGLFMLPQVGDECWVEMSFDGDWIYTGFFWSGRNAKPSDATRNVRVLRTPAGHQLKFDESGDIEIEHSSGNKITMKANGDINVNSSGDVKVEAGGNILLNDEGSSKVVTTLALCSFTGAPHPQGSKTVFAKGPI